MELSLILLADDEKLLFSEYETPICSSTYREDDIKKKVFQFICIDLRNLLLMKSNANALDKKRNCVIRNANEKVVLLINFWLYASITIANLKPNGSNLLAEP